MIETLRTLAMWLFTLMNFVGAFKEGAGVEGFGSGNPLQDYTFLTVLAILLCFIIIFAFASPASRKGIFSRIWALKPLWIFGFYILICQMIFGSEMGEKKVWNIWVFVLPACALFVGLIRAPKNLIHFLWFIVIFGTFLTAVAFVFQTKNPFLFLASGSATGRSWTYIQYGALACSAGLVSLMWSIESPDKPPLKLMWLFLALLNMGGVIYSGERGSILFVPFILLIYFWLSGRLFKLGSIKFIWIILIFTTMSVAGARFMQSEHGELFKERFATLGLDSRSQEKDARIDAGGEYFTGVRSAFFQNPVFGVGSGNYFGFNHGGYPHNMPLEVFGELGLIGLILYLYILKKAWRGIRRARSMMADAPYFAYLSVFLLYFFRTFKTGDIPGSRYFWLLLASWLVFEQTSKIVTDHKKP